MATPRYNKDAGALLSEVRIHATAEKSSEMAYWEKAATTRWGKYITEVENRVIMRGQFLAGEPGQALEIGCGAGRWSKLLSDLGWQMTCVDADRQALDICQQKIPEAKCVLVHPDDETIPCDPACVSLLLCIEVAAVMETHWFLSEAYRVLKSEGIFVVVCWNRRSWRGMACRLKYRLTRSRDACYFYKRSYSYWKVKLANSGFQVIDEEGLCWAPFGRTSNSALIPAFIGVERALGLHRLTAFSPWVVFVARKVTRK